jgi:hypothetical protein
VIEAAALEHRPGRGRQGRAIENLKRMENRRRANLQKDVP